MEKFTDGMKASVYFTFNRNNLTNEHNALELMRARQQFKQVCFPDTYGKYIKEIVIPV